MTGTAFNQNTFNAYAYNDRNEVVGGQKFQGTDPNDKNNPIPSYDYDYNYDPIGNRQTFTDSGTQTTYTTNNLNQYTQLSSFPTQPSHDLDGNMTFLPSTSGGGAGGEGWHCQWNGENRLIAMETAGPAVDPVKLTFTYDYMGRRVRKQVFEWDDQADLWSPTADLRFIYDNWNLIAQLRTQNSELGTDTTYTWGLDLSQSLQGAGGVGGLLATTEHTENTESVHYATYDANGNISEYLAPDGTIAAHYEYSPFGQLTATGGTTPEAFDHRFSTKFLDDETKLYYYGYRYYSPELGRWVNRDQIGELGGVNLYAFTANFPVGAADFLGHLQLTNLIPDCGILIWLVHWPTLVNLEPGTNPKCRRVIPLSCKNATKHMGGHKRYELPETPRSTGNIGIGAGTDNGDYEGGPDGFINFVGDAFEGVNDAVSRLCPSAEEQENCCEYRENHEPDSETTDWDVYDCCHCTEFTVAFKVTWGGQAWQDAYGSDEWSDAFGIGSGVKAKYSCDTGNWSYVTGPGFNDLLDTAKTVDDWTTQYDD